MAAVAALLVLQGTPVAADDKRAVLSWDVLGQFSVVKEQGRFVPQFSKELAGLDRTEVKLQGFMMPLEAAGKQQRFLLTSMPPSCPYCMSPGVDQLVEVQAKTGVKYILDAIVVSGKLTLLRDDPGGLLYRLTEAVVTER
jgi:hypothetical protein